MRSAIATGRILCGRRRRRQSMRSESAVAVMSLQMSWAGRYRRSFAGSQTWRLCKSLSLACGGCGCAATALRRSALRSRLARGCRAVCFTRTSSPARSGAGSAASPSSSICKAPCRRQSVSGTMRFGVLGAALACLAPWGCERGWCGARGAGAARGESGSSGEGGTPEHHGGRLSQPFGTAAVPSAAVLRGYCGSTTRCAAAPAGSARLVRGRGGCYARYGGATVWRTH